MIKLGWNLIFNGQCETAFKFYEKTLGGKINIMMTWGDSPMAKDVPADWAKKITHASMIVGDQELTGGDLPSADYQNPQGFSVILNMTDTTEADRVFKALSEGGVIKMPLQETFWAARWGMVADRFGIPWMINCGKPA
jgi:PhnB protein